MKIEHHYNLQTKLTPSIDNNQTRLTSCTHEYFETILKTALQHVI